MKQDMAFNVDLTMEMTDITNLLLFTDMLN